MRIETPPFDYATFEAQLAIFLPCQHHGAEPRFKIKSTGKPYFKIQCPHCGKPLSGQLPFAVVEDFRHTWGRIKPWDHAKEEQWVERRLSVGEILRGDQNLRRRAAWWSQYEEYLLGDEWRDIRHRIMDRAAGRCEKCRERSPKHVHHLCYDRVGHEEETDLMAVCLECHQSLHPHRNLLGAH